MYTMKVLHKVLKCGTFMVYTMKTIYILTTRWQVSRNHVLVSSKFISLVSIELLKTFASETHEKFRL